MTRSTWLFLVGTLIAGALFGALISLPSKWDKATIIKVCGGRPIIQLEDGTTWLRYRWHNYRVENVQALC